MTCRFCGDEVDPSDLLHVLQCDGRQGARDASDAPYPENAGWKEPTTSKEAAASVDAATLRIAVGRCLSLHGAMTADECAARLHLSVLSIRPRFSELRAKGAITDTGIRHANVSGKRAVVWDLTKSEDTWKSA